MTKRFLICLLFLTVVAFAQEGKKALLHVTQVKHADTSEQMDEHQFTTEHRVWGYTDRTEYVLACYETSKVENGSVKVEFPCAPMNAGGTYEVKVFSKAILYPADQPNQPTYAWYMVRQERERSKK